MSDDDRNRRIARLSDEIRRLGEIGVSQFDRMSDSDAGANERRAAMDERWRKLQERAALLREEEAPLLEALAARGVYVASVAELTRVARPSEGVLALLLGHLQRPYHDDTLAAMTLVFAQGAARRYFAFFREEFMQPRSPHSVYDAAIAVLFLKTAKIADIDEIVGMIAGSDKPARTILLRVLRKFRNKSPKAQAAIERFACDPALGQEIRRWPEPRRRMRPALH